MTEPTNLQIAIPTMRARVADDTHAPTIGERLRIKKVSFIDENVKPEEGKSAADQPKQLAVIVRNYRGYLKGQQGRRPEGAFKDGLLIQDMPDFLPFDQIDEFCEELKKLKKAGEVECAKATGNTAVKEAE